MDSSNETKNLPLIKLAALTWNTYDGAKYKSGKEKTPIVVFPAYKVKTSKKDMFSIIKNSGTENT